MHCSFISSISAPFLCSCLRDFVLKGRTVCKGEAWWNHFHWTRDVPECGEGSRRKLGTYLVPTYSLLSFRIALLPHRVGGRALTPRETHCQSQSCLPTRTFHNAKLFRLVYWIFVLVPPQKTSFFLYFPWHRWCLSGHFFLVIFNSAKLKRWFYFYHRVKKQPKNTIKIKVVEPIKL